VESRNRLRQPCATVIPGEAVTAWGESPNPLTLTWVWVTPRAMEFGRHFRNVHR